MSLGAKRIPPRPPAKSNVLSTPFSQGNQAQQGKQLHTDLFDFIDYNNNNAAVLFDEHNEDEIFTADPMPDNNMNDP